MAKSQKDPSYRKRTIRGKDHGLVTLKDSVTGQRKDFWLGEYGSNESKEKYHRVITEWIANGRRLPGSGVGPAPLPPRPPIDWTPALCKKFDQALLALGQLDSVSPPLPDTSLFHGSCVTVGIPRPLHHRDKWFAPS